MNFGLQGAPYNSNENEIDIKKSQRKKTLRRPINNGRLSENNGMPVNAGGERHYNKNVEAMIGSIHSQISPTAFFFYNYACYSLKGKECLIIY